MSAAVRVHHSSVEPCMNGGTRHANEATGLDVYAGEPWRTVTAGKVEA